MNIEEEFLKLDKDYSVFPHEKDYVGIYKTFKSAFDKDVHPEIKTKILEIEKEGYYNDHGVDHIKMVIDRVSKIITCLNPSLTSEPEKFHISPYEIFILLMAIQLHDSGHLIGSRVDHAKKGKELLAKFDPGNILNTSEKLIIGNIAKAHGGQEDPIGKLQPIDMLSHQKIRPQFLAALLRLGDELAEDLTRASKFLIDIDQLEKTSKIFHLYSASLDSISFNEREIQLSFYVMDKFLIDKYPKKTKSGIVQEYLITEIYKRTQKTFLEALYCGRFLPEECRFNKVRVKINLVKSSDHDEITDPIGYDLKENGYPTLEKNDIFQACDSLTLHGGQQIDGDYLSSLIKSKLQSV
ncbi:HD domain-containing protein [Mucilaginibacter sp. UYCu711]|uniref:HD domain-containing protein n=1 Tax=Mucilaginibacter sp. UYCu711 TaxID=3156339 RepID=UPI003D24DD60